jgi:hypothetical protein
MLSRGGRALAICTVALTAACGATFSPAPVPLGGPALMEGLQARTVRVDVVCPGAKLGDSWGSGVILRTSYVATAAHVADPKCRLLVNGVPAYTVARDEKADVAIVWVLSQRRWVDLEPAAPYLGQPVVTVGYPGEYSDGQPHLAVSPGYITTTVRGMYRVNTPTYAGNSGGPVFDRAGRLVGLFVSSWSLPVMGGTLPFDGAYYATDARHVFRLLATL